MMSEEVSATSPSQRSASAVSASRRRAHRKSRTGCFECRRRRIKCTEEKPDCNSCVRHGAECHYPSLPTAPRKDDDVRETEPAHEPGASCSPLPRPAVAPLRGLAETETVSPAPPWADSQPLPDLPVPTSAAGSLSSCRCQSRCICTEYSPKASNFDMDDLVLFHHWTLFASRDIYKSPPVDYCWQTVMPRLAFHNPFVMHGILSLSALHLAHTDPSCRQYRIVDASRHHNTSLQGFREAINHITEHNSDALFAYSLLNLLYTFAILKVDTAGTEADTSKARNAMILGNEWIPMIQGVQAVLEPVYEHVRFGPLGPVTDVGNWEELNIDDDSHPDNATFRRLSETWVDSPDAQVYDETLLVLRRGRLYIAQFQTMDDESLRKWGYNRGWAGPLLFLCTAPRAFLTRLHQRQPQALVLFAYFGALLHGLNDFWFLEGWGRDIVEVIGEMLGDYWRPWMEWPRDATGLN